jgi:archaeal flagellin FlaB
MTRTFNRNDAFTGLEAAIVLIAFVVVAAVFSYVVLGAGFFTTQKSQEVVHTGVSTASSNIAILGEVYGDASGQGMIGSPHIHTVIFSAGMAAGGTPIDMNRTRMTFQNSTTYVSLDYASTLYNPGNCGAGGAAPPGMNQWVICSVQNSDGDLLLESNERFTIWARLTPTTAGALPARDQFSIDIKPDLGASLSVSRTTPPGIDQMNLLY